MRAMIVLILSLLVVASSYDPNKPGAKVYHHSMKHNLPVPHGGLGFLSRHPSPKHHLAAGSEKLDLLSIAREIRSEALSMASAQRHHWGRWLTLVIVIIFLSTAAGATLLGNTIKKIIMEMDTKVIGVDVEMGKLSVNLCRGEIHMQGFKVMNPEGYSSPYLFNADKLVVNMGMMSIITSLGKKILLKNLTLENIDAIIEYDGYFGGTSNIQKLMDNMGHSKDGKGADGKPDAKPSEKKKKEEPTDGDAEKPEKPEKPEKSAREIIVKKVHMTDIGAKLSTKLAGMRAAIGDINYDDFSDEVGAHMIDDIAWVIIGTLGKTVLTNLVGKKAADWLD